MNYVNSSLLHTDDHITSQLQCCNFYLISLPLATNKSSMTPSVPNPKSQPHSFSGKLNLAQPGLR